MKMQSFWGSICLINLVLGAAQGCESDEMEFEPTAMETISIPISNAPEPSETGGMIESEPGDTAQDAEQTAISGGAEVDEYGNCIIDGVPTACPDTKGEVKRAPILLPELEKYVNDPSCKSEMIDLAIALDDALIADDFKLSAEDDAKFENIKDTFNLIFSYVDGEEYLNGMELTKELSDELTKLMEVKRNHVSQQQLKKKSAIIDTIIQSGIRIDDEALETYRNGNMSLQIQYDRCKISDLLKIPSLLGIEVALQPINNSLASAMQATGIAQEMSNQPNAPYGNNTGVYMSEANCPSPGYLTRYTRLSNTNSSVIETHSRNTSSIIRTVSPNSYIYCREGTIVPTDQDLAMNSSTNPRIAVASFSSSLCDTASHPNYTIRDRDIDDFVLYKNIPVVIAAGNRTTDCVGYYVHSLAKGLNVNTIGNFDDHSNTPSMFRMRSASCYLDPETHNFKPEISAPGTSITAGTDTNGTSITLTGTSQATAHVAGLLADIASGFSDTSRFTAALARVRLLASAQDVIVYNPDGTSSSYDRAGLGGVHYSRLKSPSFYTWYEGNYHELAANDLYPNNNAIDHLIQVGSNISIIRLHLVWLNSGTWTYNHRSDQYPMGRRFTLYLYNPYGNYITHATNSYAGYAHLEANLTMSGTYHVKIELSEERDTSSFLRMAYAGYYY